MALADAYLRTFGAEGLQGHREEAVWAYEVMMGRLGERVDQGGEDLLRRHAAQMALLVPDDELEHLINEGAEAAPETWSFREDAGKRLLRWWRSQDSVPATSENERLEEHIERAGYALRHYSDDGHVTGLDDRGRIYVQYGKPFNVHTLDFNETDFQKEVFRFGVPVSASDFPENEIWTYHHIDRAAYYIFVRDTGEHYRLGDVRDLLPPRLREVGGESERRLNIAMSALAALRYIYEELSKLQGAFGPYYSRVDDYMMWQEEKEMMRSLGAREGFEGRQATVGEGQTSREVSWDPQIGIDPPNTVLQTTLSESASAEARLERERDERMPEHHTSVLDGKEELPIAMRTARFLEEEGTTDTEIYWAFPPGALAVSGDVEAQYRDSKYWQAGQYLINVTGVGHDEDYRRGDINRERYVVEQSGSGGENLLALQSHIVSGNTGVYHIGLQWEQYLVDTEAGGVDLGPQVKLSTRCIDSLQALSPNEGELEVSDLKPMMLPGESAFARGETLEEAAILFPFEQIASETPLLLYFEVYHLAFGEGDRTRYSVEYEVLRRRERGGLARLFRGPSEEGTSTEAQYRGESRTAREYIMIDLSEWGEAESSELQIVVRVTDEVTGQQKERSIRFDVVQE